MSCGNPTVETDALMPRKKKYDKTNECVRCKTSLGNIVIRHAVYCKECFFPLVTFKFRRALEPFVNAKPDGPRRTALKPKGNLLVGFSGGLGSTVLLDLVYRCYVSMDKSTMPAEGGKQHPRHERVWKKVSVCYVEVCDIFPGMKDRTPEVAQLVAQHDGLEFIPLRIQDAFDSSWWARAHSSPGRIDLGVDLTNEELFLNSVPSSTSSTPLESLRTFLASLPTATAMSSTINSLIRLLLLHTALDTGSSHLVLGSSLTSLAVSLISGVSQGRGFNVKEEMQEEWFPDRAPEPSSQREKRTGKGERSVRVIRPLRDVGRKECAAWAWWSGLRVLGRETWPWPGLKQDIGTLTKNFIFGLEKDYPSTVSTIVRTCTKVAPKGEASGICVLCARPIQAGIQEWKSRISIRSRSPGDAIDEKTPVGPSLASHLCYACHTTLTSTSSRPAPPFDATVTKSSLVALPVWVPPQFSEKEELFRTQKMGQEKMRNVVQDFLLDE
ncbi:hypothetical protein WOLCODRAFT_137967 [Wolfiporia cocos MD-104 SS10]|uniref:Cytoplasmic tRNA 2-thiolation protein 2 n=1 Tax=Wolfiporia cocos (strain MD-104) TaxID=742152 RepID=A0A2H3JK54_WOLCO|nr:hypothetical protein WOLCODRAFT_137967 [Wolfiporia cocos MD-104 SS10]